MSAPLSRYTAGRDNNFNLLRFVAASLVLYSHSFPLAGAGAAEPLARLVGLSWGEVAVDVFFVTSGFLITRSFLERKSLVAFAWARILRIYPALIVAVLISAFLLGAFFTTLGLSAYFTDPQTYRYVAKTSFLFANVEYDLPGVFADNPYNSAVNGSLWTLPYEVKLYVRLAVIAMVLLYAQRYFRWPLIKFGFLAIALISTGLNIFHHFYSESAEHFVRFSSTFFAGAAFYVYRDQLLLSTRFFFLLLVALLLSGIREDIFFVVYRLSLPYLVLYLAYAPAGAIRAFNTLGDYSYGLYIYASPSQQAIVALLPGVSAYSLAATSFAITLLLAIASWHGVEKRCLAMKGRAVALERVLSGLRLTHMASRQPGP